MSTPIWPSAGDYVMAIQDPEHCFRRRDLCGGVIRTGLFDLPASASGQNAVVFTSRISGVDWALRCHTHPPEAGGARMRALEAHLSGVPHPAFVSASWIDQGILVRERWWPMVQMAWVEGKTLDQAVLERLEDPPALADLAHRFGSAVRAMDDGGLAHGDLQHGNVMVTSTGEIRFVDYDGIWVADAGLPAPREVGHPNYQHPERGRTGAWGAGIDAFSAFVIHLSLLAVAAEPRLWEKYHTGENLLFRAADFDRPGGSELFDHLRRLGVPDLGLLAARLARASMAPLASIGRFADLLDVTTDIGRAGPATAGPGQWWADPEAHLAGSTVTVESDVVNPAIDERVIPEPVVPAPERASKERAARLVGGSPTVAATVRPTEGPRVDASRDEERPALAVAAAEPSRAGSRGTPGGSARSRASSRRRAVVAFILTALVVAVIGLLILLAASDSSDSPSVGGATGEPPSVASIGAAGAR